jgi:CelD/BcsL family acetyltransferase involved in cellulose biosynthesis
MQEKKPIRVDLRKFSDVSVEIIDNADNWEEMKAQWDDLVTQSLSPSFFLTYEFLSSAWKALGDAKILHILLIRVGKNLLGIIPLKITQRKICGIPTKTIEPIATAIAERDFFIVLKNEPLFYEAFVSYLFENTHLWNKFNFMRLPIDHPFLEAVRNTFSCSKGIMLQQQENLIHTCVNISDQWEDYFYNLKPKFRRKLCSSIEDLCAQGNVGIIRANDPNRIGRYLEWYVEIEERSWKNSMNSRITRTEDLFNIYQLMLKTCAEKEWAELTFLMLNSQLIAGGIHIIFEKDFVYLQTVYDEAASKYNPGTLLMTINVWRAFEKRLKRIHFMGNYPEYKRNWANFEWQSFNICARERISGEGLAYYGSRWVKNPILRLNKKSWKWRRGILHKSELVPLTVNNEELRKETVMLNKDDIKRIFFLANLQSKLPEKQESTVSLIPAHEVERLVTERSSARQKNEWKRADEIRNYLTQKGIVINDTPQGTIWKYSSEAKSRADFF